MPKTTPTPKPSPFGPRETQRILARRKKWTDALRSGKFKQTTCTLHDDDGHCCLGVADIVCKLKENQAGLLSVRNLQRLGLTETQEEALIKLNDGDGKSFKHIARVIDKLPIEKEV